MELLISELAKLTGVSVRTLHYYDEIGLLKPQFVDEQNGYRFYSDESVIRMQEILFYRELDFSLKDILQILSSENYDKESALNDQKQLLILKKQRLEKLIGLIDSNLKGEDTMSFESFDNTKYNEYVKEAKERWGNTKAYKEFEEKSNNFSKEKLYSNEEKTEMIMKEFADLFISGEDFSSTKTQTLVKKWQDFVTENYYECTKEILSGLGLMYTEDERFKNNLDKYKVGTAEFISNAIKVYCK